MSRHRNRRPALFTVASFTVAAFAITGGLVAPVSRAATSAPKAGATCRTVGSTNAGLTCKRNAAGKAVWTRASAPTTAAPSTAAPATTKAPAPASTAAPAAPSGKAGGKIVFAIEAETSGGWTPSTTQWAMSGNFVRQTMIENLVMPNTDGSPECLLCESITPNSRYTEWTIKVRPGIKFHNGEALDSAAVKANFDDLRRNASVTGALLRPITSVEIVDPLTVKLMLSGPFVNFAAILQNQRSAMVAPAQIKDPQGRNNPVGTGPYVFKSWKLNDSLVVTKNPSYWRKDAQPLLDEITFKVVTEETARVTAFKAGDVQGIMTVNPLKIAELKDLQKSGKAQVVEIVKNPGINNILFQLDRAPTNDLRVRTALALATDRQGLNEINNAGILKIVDVPFVPGDASKLTGVYPKTDINKAKSLIEAYSKETGKSVEITLNTSAVPENIENAQTLQQMWEKIGVKVKIVATEQAAYVRQVQVGDFQVATFRFQSALDPEDLRAILHSENYQPIGTVTANYMRWKNGIVDAAFDQLRTNSDPKVRRRAADTIATELTLDWPMVITSATTWGVAVNGNYQLGTPKLPSGRDLQSSPTGAYWLSAVSAK